MMLCMKRPRTEDRAKAHGVLIVDLRSVSRSRLESNSQWQPMEVTKTELPMSMLMQPWQLLLLKSLKISKTLTVEESISRHLLMTTSHIEDQLKCVMKNKLNSD